MYVCRNLGDIITCRGAMRRWGIGADTEGFLLLERRAGRNVGYLGLGRLVYTHRIKRCVRPAVRGGRITLILVDATRRVSETSGC